MSGESSSRPFSLLILTAAAVAFGVAVGFVVGKRSKKSRNKVGLLGCIGETCLIELKSLSQLLGRSVFVKLEMLNVGGTSKDRAAKQMLLDAKLRPGQTVYEVRMEETDGKAFEEN